jgi:hypothetical protein
MVERIILKRKFKVQHGPKINTFPNQVGGVWHWIGSTFKTFKSQSIMKTLSLKYDNIY